METTKEQTKDEEPSVDDMRYDLAEREAMNMGVSEIIEILINGVQGLDEMSDLEIRDEWEYYFKVDKD